jgi:cytochrome b561
MIDWAPLVVGVVLFVLLSPRLLLELPGTRRCVDFCSHRTTGKAITIHTLVFFTLFAVITLGFKLRIYTGA